MVTLFNYGWTGIFGACVLLLVTKFHRPFEVRLWAWHMKKAGVSKQDIKDLWKREVTKNGQDFIIQLTESRRQNPQPEVQPSPAPVQPKPTPRKPAPRTTSNATPANPTTPATKPSTQPKRASTAKASCANRAKPQSKPEPSVAIPEQSRGRHAKPDEDELV